jgi:hypothetical protein
MKKKFFTNLWLTFHSWSPRFFIFPKNKTPQYNNYTNAPAFCKIKVSYSKILLNFKTPFSEMCSICLPNNVTAPYLLTNKTNPIII